MKINHSQVVIICKTKWNQMWYLKANSLLWYMFQSNEASGIIFNMINRLIQAEIWYASYKLLFEINS